MLLTASASYAQDNMHEGINHMEVQGRFGYQYQTWDGLTSNDNSGFKGQNIYFTLDGLITKQLKYEYRQRLDNIGKVKFFDATELLNVTWAASHHLYLSAGKQVFALGNSEIQTPMPQQYYCSEFRTMFNPYEFGASVDVKIGRRDDITLQVINSPLRNEFGNLYGAGLMWTGRHGFYQAQWSVNAMQYKLSSISDKEMLNYIALSNRFTFMPGFYLNIDVMNRSTFDDLKFAKDYTASAELSAAPVKGLRIYGKYTRDANEDTAEDYMVTPGTELNTASAGIEYETMDHSLGQVCVFATGMYSWGENTSPAGGIYEKEIRVQAGVKMNLDIIGSIESIIRKK